MNKDKCLIFVVMNLPEEIQQQLSEQFGAFQSFRSASGGCINHGGIAKFDKGSFFVKWNNAEKFPEMFSLEAQGLELLRLGTIKIPEVLLVGEVANYSFLVLEEINSSFISNIYWEELGRGLADLHKISDTHFGLENDNYMGSLKQVNSQIQDWSSFYIENRLETQSALAFNAHLLSKEDLRLIQLFYKNIKDHLTIESPSLVHGDLWNGNVMVGSSGEPVLIDPAVSFLNREVDLAMAKLFGGFDEQFYQAYQEALPVQSGIECRIEIYQLYPLLVHLNLFGSGYYSQCLSIIKRFT